MELNFQALQEAIRRYKEDSQFADEVNEIIRCLERIDGFFTGEVLDGIGRGSGLAILLGEEKIKELERRIEELLEMINHETRCMINVGSGPCDCGYTDYMFSLLHIEDWHEKELK